MRYSPIALLVACTLAGSAAHAEKNKITFEGEVTDQTCEVKINNATTTTVMLPTVSQKELDANTVAGATPFVVSVSGCETPKTTSKKQTVNIHLYSANISEKGNLTNSDSTTKGVAVQLLDKNGPINLKDEPLLKVGDIEENNLELTKTFTAQYVKEGDITPGKVNTVVEYELSYL